MASIFERMFGMWIDPAHLAQWLPPTGASMRFLRSEPRLGGSSLYVMTGADGGVMYGLVKYIAIEASGRLVYTQQFCDEHENIMRSPFSRDWPETMLTTVELASKGVSRTRVTVQWEPVDGATPADIAEFVKQRGGMTLGWTGSFDKLEAAVR